MRTRKQQVDIVIQEKNTKYLSLVAQHMPLNLYLV